MNQKGFIFDYSKCVGCHACIVGCYNENKVNPPITWRQVNSYNQKKIPLSGFLNLSIACNHCIDAPCLKACPASAYHRDIQTGAVIHHPEKCIGCKYCTWACPFDAPRYNHEKGTVEKCHLCNHLIISDLRPACANQCPTGALSFDLIEESTQIDSIGIPKNSFQPKIRTLGSSFIMDLPEMDNSISGFNQGQLIENKFNEKIHAAEEWPLVLFTFIYSFLSGWILSSKIYDRPFQKLIFIIIGLIGILLSAFHLGKPLRAIRSTINLKTSWLSREILFSGFFIVASTLYLFFFHVLIFQLITILFGFCLLLSIEMVYSITNKKYKTPIHSSNTILTAFLFGFYFLGAEKLIVAIIVIKALLYIIRKKDLENMLYSRIFLITLIRIIAGQFLPLALLLFSNWVNLSAVLVLLIIGEFIDRFEFYNDIYVDSPSRILDQTLKEKLRV